MKYVRLMLCFCVLISLVAYAADYPAPVGLWEFENGGNLAAATVGSNLGLTGGGITSSSGVGGADAGAVRVDVGSYLQMTHNISPGSSGGANVNEYTLLLDVNYESSTPWKCLFQAGSHGSADGELFIKSGTGTIGVGDLGYSSNQTSAGNWYRVVVTVDNGVARKVYVNGSEWVPGNAGALDDRFSLLSTVSIFDDNDGEDGVIKASNLAVWDQALTSSDASSLGVAGGVIETGTGTNQPPSINSSPPLTATVNQAYNYTVTATDPNGDPLTYSGVTVPSWLSFNGGTQVLSGTPSGLDTGTHPVELSVSDGTESVSQNFNITVSSGGGSGPNLVLNPSFEEGATWPDSWSTDTNAVWSTADAQDGTHSMLIPTDIGNVSQEFTVTNGMTYYLSVWVNAAGYNGTGITVFDSWDKYDGPGECQFVINEVADAPGWTEMTGTFTATNTHLIKFRIFSDATFAGDVYFDNVSLTVDVFDSDEPPVIAEGSVYVLNASKDGGAATAELKVSDADGDTLDWSVQSQGANGIAAINSESNTNAVFSYTPNGGFSGVDSFEIDVSDGTFSDTISVNVSVVDPGANPELTVICPYGTPAPTAGSHSYSLGNTVVANVTGETTADTRHIPVGWAIIGSGPSAGNTNAVSFEIRRDTVLTWEFSTEYLIDTQAGTGGTVDVADGWHSADHPLMITAEASSGYYFSGWSGDTAGAVTAENRIILPMDRAVGTITANFAQAEVFSIVALPDTQVYSAQESSFFPEQTQWIVDNIVTENIKFVTHEGDIVHNTDNSGQWTWANQSMDILNGEIPYGTCPGNHDMQDGLLTYLTHYGPGASRWIDSQTSELYDWYKGVSPSGWSDYQMLEINGMDWLFLHMDIDARDPDITWAQSVLDANPKALAVMTTHNYLAQDGGTGGTGSGDGEPGRCQTTYARGDGNSPEEVFQKLVKPNNQIFMVLCGHNYACYHITDLNQDGNIVHEVITDLQTLPNGGEGYLRQIEFTMSENKMNHTTYSPHYDRYWNPSLYPGDDNGLTSFNNPDAADFDLSVDLYGRFDKTLTVVSPQTPVIPAVGTTTIHKGGLVNAVAQDVVAGSSREHVTGWALVSSGDTTSGVGNSAPLTVDEDSTLTWNYETQYYLETESTGDGLISIPSSWQTAGQTVEIVAQPDAGATFIGWSGDIAGAVIDGTKISFTMDRARGPVTAEFSVPSAGSGYEEWATANSVDPGTLANLLEYALDGDTTTYGDSEPTFTKEGSEFKYVHPQRSDDPNLVYTVEISADLTANDWAPAGVTAVTNITGTEYNVVTNSIPTTGPQSYIRLRITNQ